MNADLATDSPNNRMADSTILAEWCTSYSRELTDEWSLIKSSLPKSTTIVASFERYPEDLLDMLHPGC